MGTFRVSALGARVVGFISVLFPLAVYAYTSPIENKTVETVTSSWTVSTNLFVGEFSSGNGLIVTNGGTVSTENYTYVGYGTAADNNYAVISGAGSRISCNGTRIGSRGAHNSLRIENGGMFYSSISGFYSAVGDYAGSDYNSLIVDGSNSVWDANYIAIGNSSSYNRLVVTNGGYVFADVSMLVGRRGGAAANRVEVSGAGSKVDVDRYLYMGCQWAGSSTEIEDTGGAGNTVSVADGAVFDVVLNIYNSNRSKIEIGKKGKVYSRGGYFQTSGASLNISCLTDPLESGQLVVGGSASLSGDLVIDVPGDFSPAGGYSARILNVSGSISGAFDSMVLPELPAGLGWDTSALYSTGTLAVQETTPGEIQGSKWLDLNTNSLWDAGEPPLENWKIFADVNRNQTCDEGEPFDLTDASGSYSLIVPPGQNVVGEVLPADWMQIYPGGTSGLGYSNVLGEVNTCFAPNVLDFTFTNLPSATGDGTLTVYAFSDLDSSSEYLTLQADGQSMGNLFVAGGRQQAAASTDMVLEQSVLNGMLDDRSITFKVTPSSAVANLGPTELRLTLQYPSQGGFHSVDVGSGSMMTNINFGNMITGLYINVTLPDAAAEGDGEIEGLLQLSHPAFVDTVINLSSDDASALTLTNTLLVSAGQSNAILKAYVTDDALVDGTQLVSVQASSPGYTSGIHMVSIHDNESAALSLNLPQTTFEGAGTLAGILTVSPAPDKEVTVDLISNHPSKIPGMRVVVPAGQTIVPVVLNVIDDNLIDGVQTATITAHVQNWTESAAAIFIFDNESSALTVSLPASAVEGDGLLTNAGVVSASGVVGVDTHVVLDNSDGTEINIPSVVTIPQGQSSVSFDIDVVDDAETDGTQNLSVVGTSPGFVTGFDSMMVFDNDIHHFMVGSVDSQQVAGVTFPLEVTAETIDGLPITNFTASVTVSAAGAAGILPVDPAAFDLSAGQWVGEVSVNGISSNVVLLVDDGAGHAGTSSVFNVEGALVVITPAALTNTLVVAGESITRTMVISNAGNVDLEFEIMGAGSKPEPVDPALVAYFPFNGDAADASGNGHDGTVSGAVLTTDRFGNADSAYDFNGSSAYINCGNIINGFSNFTVSAWLNIDRFTDVSYMGPWSQQQFTYSIINGNYHFYTASGSSGFGTTMRWDDGIGLNSRTSYAVSLNEWHLITQTYDGNEVRQYDNGVLINATVTGAHTLSNGWDFLIGKTCAYPGYLTVDYFDGTIDELRVYNRALSEAEVIAFYNEEDSAASDDLTSGLMASFLFNGNPHDESNGYTGTISGGATLTTDRFGNPDSAYSFNGGAYITYGDILDRGDKSHSYNLWVKTSTFDQHAMLLGKGISTYGSPRYDGWGVYNYPFDTGKGYHAIYGDHSGSSANLDRLGVSNEAIPVDEWVMLSGIYDIEGATAELRLYVNGVLAGSESFPLPTTPSNDNLPFNIGGLYYGFGNIATDSGFVGDIDDISIYNRALSVSEITSLYNETAGGDSGLVAHYPFNGDAADASGNGHDGLVKNGGVFTNDVSGRSCMYFDGIDDFVHVPGHSDFSVTNFTLSAWVKPQDNNNSEINYTVVATTLPEPRTGVQMALVDLNLQGMFRKGGTSPSHASTTDEPIVDAFDKWSFVAVSSYHTNGQQIVELYADGVLKKTEAFTSVPPGYDNQDLLIGMNGYGAAAGNGWTSQREFEGFLDDVRIHNRALSEAEITELYNEVEGDAGLIASYPFNGDAADASGNGHDGTVSGATLTTDRFGNADSAYLFDGVNDYIEVPDAPDLRLNGTDFSISAWVFETARNAASQDAVLTKRGSGSRNGWFSGIIGNGAGSSVVGKLAYATSGGSDPSARSTSILSLMEWHHTVMAYSISNSTLSIYIDGVLDSVHASIPSPNISTTANMFIGLDSAGLGYAFHGIIDDIRIYNRALSESDILALFNATDVVEPPPSASWLSATPMSGTVAPGASMSIDVRFDAAGLMAGDYSNTTLTVMCNDMLAPSNRVPASMYAVPPAPRMAAEPEYTVGSSNSVAWSAVDGPVTYWVEAATATNTAAMQNSGWGTNTNHTFGGLGTNTTYYRVKASAPSSIGPLESAWSDWVWSMQVVDLVDFDGDGMPNWWEQLYFGGPHGADPMLDSDGDGQINRDEFIAGMDPTNSESCFMIRSFESPTNGAFMVTWDAVTGRVYTVQWKDCMTNGFQALETGIRHPQNSYTDSIHSAEDCGFYSIDVELGQ